MTKPKELPSKEMLDSLFSYDAETGKLFWKERQAEHFVNGGHMAAHNASKWNGKHAGKEALTAVKGDGYLHGSCLGKSITAHRVAWKIITGDDPIMIDHINGERKDNRFANLRSVQTKLNARNMARQARHTNPHVGVRETKNGRWQAYVSPDGVFISLGCHDTIAEAIAARKAGQVAFAFHANHGRKAASLHEEKI